MNLSAERLKTRALELGFNLVGVARAEPSPTLAAYERWIDAGMQGSMGYLARPDRLARRRDLNVILPGVRTLIIVGVDYRAWLPADLLADPARGRIAAYAWGQDYHAVLAERLEQFAAWLAHDSGMGFAHRVYVDTGALLERSHAQTAGLGFIGKNTMLIHPRLGSYFFLGELLTTAECDHYDQPHRPTLCGSCTRCLVGCPTDAFPQPYVLDARRCISYLTIEHKGWLERELRPLMGNWVFGCDVCQDVCPWQRFAPETGVSAFKPVDIERAAPPLRTLLSLDDVTFQRLFGGSPVARIKRGRLVRNACIAAANWGDESVVPLVRPLLADDDPLVRGHAAWALSRLAGADAAADLRRQLARETDAAVRAELESALG